MTRMTKEQRMQIQEQYLAEQEAMERAEYFPKLMEALVSACALGYTLEAQRGEFLLRERNWSDGYTVRLGAEYSRQNLIKLELFERELQDKRDELEEIARKARMKQAALAKLTAEERELLGL